MPRARLDGHPWLWLTQVSPHPPKLARRVTSTSRLVKIPLGVPLRARSKEMEFPPALRHVNYGSKNYSAARGDDDEIFI